jgi:SAM-dependent methyltransferase
MILDLPGNAESRVNQCSACGFRFLYPCYKYGDINHIYGDSYFTSDQAEGQAYVAPVSGTAYQEYADARRQKFIDSLSLIQKMFPDARSIIDVGSATGEFLMLAKARGFESLGIEVSEYAAAVAREKYNLDIRVGTLEKFVAPKCYDVVHLNHILEHCVDPHKAVEALTKLVPTGGAIYVEVPFQFNWVELANYWVRKKKLPFNVHSIHHPLFFSPSTLKRLFAMHSFSLAFIRVFDWRRYPKAEFVDWGKCVAWKALSALHQGGFIEAIFVKNNTK